MEGNYKGQNLGSLAFSLGVTSHPQENTMATIIKAADEALHRAKSAGRNRVVVAN